MNSIFDAFSDDEDVPRKRKQPMTISNTQSRSKDLKTEVVAGKITNLEQKDDKPVSARHQVALPANYDYVDILQHQPDKIPAREYKFTLDSFQRMAINAIERQESVLVSAHTSAGKTVVAEYAIATAIRAKQRVIYTSPIKALSNQKYRDLLQEFGDVGLMTGDVTINPEATCLVMTTEILRSMLYRGSEITREMSWVIFDEIHYMRDAIRGVVWEETLIMLPTTVHYVFLSATIPNAMQFAEWICKIKEQPCHVVYTDYRPTPLQHYLFPKDGTGIHLVVDEKSVFREDNFQKAIGALDVEEKKPQKKQKSTSDLFKIIKMINAKNYHPVICFSFSKKECEFNALQLSKLDFNTGDEKQLVKSIYENAISSLSEDDRTLPQIEHLIPLLQRGIGIHHSGLLPILKEVIEILFQEGLLKILFATETFSIGLNMPAKTVVFTNVKKFDGKEQRWLSGGEYIQMSGRAGRRGLDDRGIVILMIDQKMEPHVAKGMLKGHSDTLDSAFHLTYTMILNLSRVDGVKPEFMLQNSFHQYQNAAMVPELTKNVEILRQRADAITLDNEIEVKEYWGINNQLETLVDDWNAVCNAPTYCLPFLQPGRLVRIVSKEKDYGWSIIINYHRVFSKKGEDDGTPRHTIDILVRENPTDIDLELETCGLDCIRNLSSVRLHTPKEIKTSTSRRQLGKTLNEVNNRFGNDIPLLDPVKDMKITDASFVRLCEKIQVLKDKKAVLDTSVASIAGFSDQLELYGARLKLYKEISEKEVELQKTESVLQMDELKSRRRLLRRLGYMGEEEVITTKGRVACEISAGDEIVLTEMIFAGSFAELSIEQTNAILSCFTFSETSKETVLTQPELSKPFGVLKETAKRVANVAVECKMEMDVEAYVNGFKAELMPVVYAWSIGAKFSQVCKLTDVFEGSIIRAIRRLEELLRQLIVAARGIGNTELEERFEKCIFA